MKQFFLAGALALITPLPLCASDMEESVPLASSSSAAAPFEYGGENILCNVFEARYLVQRRQMGLQTIHDILMYLKGLAAKGMSATMDSDGYEAVAQDYIKMVEAIQLSFDITAFQAIETIPETQTVSINNHTTDDLGVSVTGLPLPFTNSLEAKDLDDALDVALGKNQEENAIFKAQQERLDTLQDALGLSKSIALSSLVAEKLSEKISALKLAKSNIAEAQYILETVLPNLDQVQTSVEEIKELFSVLWDNAEEGDLIARIGLECAKKVGAIQQILEATELLTTGLLADFQISETPESKVTVSISEITTSNLGLMSALGTPLAFTNATELMSFDSNLNTAFSIIYREIAILTAQQRELTYLSTLLESLIQNSEEQLGVLF